MMTNGYASLDWDYPTEGGATIGPIKGVQITREVVEDEACCGVDDCECGYDDDDYIHLEDRVAELEAECKAFRYAIMLMAIYAKLPIEAEHKLYKAMEKEKK